MLRWYPSVLLQIVLELTFLPIAIISIFAVNAIFDRDTPWSIGILAGPGMSADFWIILVFLACGWTIFILGWRGAKTTFKFLLIIWHLGLTSGSALLALDPGNLVLQGEAIGFAMSLEILGPILTATTLVLAIVWLAGDIRRGTRNRTVSPLQKRNKIALFIAVVGLSVAGFAFRLDFEQFATIAGILAMVALHEAVRPVNPSKELHEALVGEGSAPR